jgi:hypothetical protein
MTYTKIIHENKWKCNICGKVVAEFGWQGHNQVHRGKKTQTRLSHEERNFEHTPTCTCGKCEQEREMLGI